MAEKGAEGDRKKRVVVKKVAVDSAKEPPREPAPVQPKKVQRKVVAKAATEGGKEVRRVTPVRTTPDDQQAQQAVKRKVVPRQVERVVVRQKPREPVPTSPDQLESGFNYLIEEPQPKRSFEFFKAKVGKGTVYEYFSSKEELLFAVFEWMNEGIIERIQALLDRGGTTRERIRRLLDLGATGIMTDDGADMKSLPLSVMVKTPYFSTSF